MTNTIATFENTVGILVKAFLDGTLLKGSCCACAVGNICANAMGFTVDVEANGAKYADRTATWNGSDMILPMWRQVFTTCHGEQHTWPQKDTQGPKTEIDATGYTWQQLARIEAAFELASIDYSEEAEFAGLMAVVDVLADIHGIDLTTATAAKALFVRA